MVKKLFTVCLIFLSLLSKAQVTLNALLPPAGFVQKEQLWNLILVNNNADILDISVQLNLQDAATGQVVLTANTGNIIVGKGVKTITAKDVQPVLYNYAVPDFSKKYLPMGSYIACYQLINNGSHKGAMAEECIRINIDPLSPPMLSSPADKSEVESPYPQFTWMPPTPYDMFSNLTYDLLVTQVLEGQSPTEAIQYNTPIYTKGNINQPYESYASSFTKLDTGKTYAWQVVAKNGLNYAAKTEVWSFRIRKEIPEVTTSNDSYIFINSNTHDNNIFYENKGRLSIKYYSLNKAVDKEISIKTINGDVVQRSSLPVIPGDNFFKIDISKNISKGRLYRAEIKDAENKIYAIIFSVK